MGGSLRSSSHHQPSPLRGAVPEVKDLRVTLGWNTSCFPVFVLILEQRGWGGHVGAASRAVSDRFDPTDVSPGNRSDEMKRSEPQTCQVLLPVATLKFICSVWCEPPGVLVVPALRLLVLFYC